MQDANKEFDLIIRSMMENAEEKVPSRVWRAVSSRLNGAEAMRRPLVIWWRRAAVGLAAAAAVVIVAVLGFKKPPLNEEEMKGEIALAQTTSPADQDIVFSTKPTTSVENSSVGIEASADCSAEPRTGIKSTEPMTMTAAAQDVVPASAAQDGSAVWKEPDAREAPTDLSAEKSDEALDADEQDASAVDEVHVASAGKKTEVWTDPFALPVQDKARKTGNDRRIAMTLGTNFSSNGNASSLSGTRMMMASGTYASSDYEQVTRVSNNATYSIPLSFGVGVRVYLVRRFSVGLGLNYYLLGSTFTGTYVKIENGTEMFNLTSDIHSTLQYLGMPLAFYFDFLQGSKADVYLYGGGTIEKGLCNRYRIDYSGGDIIYKESVDGIQYSLFAGVGVQFKLNDFLGVYVDPSLHWYPDCDQPFSIRTQQQLMFDLSLGFRFDF